MSNNGEATTGAQTPSEPPETSTTSPTSLEELIKYLELPNLDCLHFVTEADLLKYSELHPLDLPTRVKFQQALKHFQLPQQPAPSTTTTNCDSTSTTTKATTTSVLVDASSHTSQAPHPLTATNPMTLNAPDNKAWLGRQDQRPIAAFIRRVADIAEMANLDACGLWKYLNLKALTEGQSRDLNAHLRQQNLSTANYGEKLLAAEHWLLTTFELTNSLDNLYQRLDSIPPNSTAEQAQSTLNAVYFDALCMDQDIHESTLKRAFIKALPKYI